jgi:HAD superfamily hydrolase (TIGR01509 family)
MIKAIIFDFFDVVRQDAFHAWMNNHGFTRADAAGDISRRIDLGEITIEQFYGELASITGQTLEEIKIEFAENEKFNREVIEYIEELKETYPIALLSNADADFLRKLLTQHELERLFNVVLISSELGVAKPDREMFKHALNALGVEPKETVFIDDQQKNIDAAEALGIRGIRFEGVVQLRAEMNKIL